MDYSVVVPVYNSISSLEILFSEIESYFVRKGASYEVIFVNDGSSIRTREALEKLNSNHENTIKVIHLDQNIGQQKALVTGLKQARGRVAITMDDDLQHDINAVDDMLYKLEEGSDLVFGIYRFYGDHYSRYLGSKLLGFVFKVQFKELKGNKVSAYRLIHRRVYQQLNCSIDDFVYLSAELLKYAHNVSNVNVTRRDRVFGRSGYTLRKCIQIGCNLIYHYGIKTMFQRKGVKSYETNPHGRRRELSKKCHQED